MSSMRPAAESPARNQAQYPAWFVTVFLWSWMAVALVPQSLWSGLVGGWQFDGVRVPRLLAAFLFGSLVASALRLAVLHRDPDVVLDFRHGIVRSEVLGLSAAALLLWSWGPPQGDSVDAPWRVVIGIDAIGLRAKAALFAYGGGIAVAYRSRLDQILEAGGEATDRDMGQRRMVTLAVLTIAPAWLIALAGLIVVGTWSTQRHSRRYFWLVIVLAVALGYQELVASQLPLLGGVVLLVGAFLGRSIANELDKESRSRPSPLPDSTIDWNQGPTAEEVWRKYLRWQTEMEMEAHKSRRKSAGAVMHRMLGHLEGALDAPSVAVRAQAVRMWAEVRPDGCAPLFAMIEGDPEADVRHAAIEAVARVDSSDAAARLRAQAAAGPPEVAWRIERAIIRGQSFAEPEESLDSSDSESHPDDDLVEVLR